MSKTPHPLPVGKLVPLPIPRQPWSHMGIDFVTDLPNSDNHTCILVAVDRFSKACRRIPLKGLSTALETAESLFTHVFTNFRIPEDIVSDRGPQFISCIWRAFFRLLGVTVSLSSGYHPQTNGQTERKIQELGRYLRAYCQDEQHSRSCYLPCTELPAAEHHLPRAIPVHTRLPAPALSVDRIAIAGSSSRLLVPSERESVGLSSRSPPTCGAKAQDICRCPAFLQSHVPSWRKGMAVLPGSAPLPALQEPESSLHRFVRDTEADK